MKLKRIVSILVCIMLVNTLFVNATTCLAFKSGGSNNTHQYIVSSALKILANDKGSTELNVTDTRDNILYFCDWPDTLSNEGDGGTYAGHFYDPSTGKNWMGKTSPTAKSRAIYYFNEAVSNYKAGNKFDAYSCLGKGLHYVADINEPHHAANLTALNSNHTDFEKYVDENRKSFSISGNSFSGSVYSSAQSTSVSSMLQSAAVTAKGLASKAQNTDTYYSAANSSVKNAITSATQYTYKFCKQVGIY